MVEYQNDEAAKDIEADLETRLEILDEEDEDTQIFRKSPQERISDPEHLDSLLVVVNSSLWQMLGGLILIVLAAVLWSFLGSLPIKVSGKGIFESKEGAFAIHSPLDGTVKGFAVEIGQLVNQGDYLGSIDGDSGNSPNSKTNKIESPHDGRILDILVHPGEMVRHGATLVWLEHATSAESPLIVEGYFPIESASALSIGQKVEMSNGMAGRISKISAYGSPAENIGRNYQAKGLEKYLSSGSYAVVTAIISPEIPEAGHNSKENLSNVQTGAVVDLKVTVEHVKPIYFLFPLKSFRYP